MCCITCMTKAKKKKKDLIVSPAPGQSSKGYLRLEENAVEKKPDVLQIQILKL